MAGSTTKKVQIWRFDRETLTGFANPVTYLTEAGVELLTLAGNVIIAKYSEVKAVFFVREFDSLMCGATSSAVPSWMDFGCD